MASRDHEQRELHELRTLLPLFVGGDLQPDQRARVEAGLTRHPALAEELERLRAARAALRDAGHGTPAGLDLWPGVRAALRDEGLLAPRPETAASLPVAALVGPTDLDAPRGRRDAAESVPATTRPLRALAWTGALAAAAALVVLLQAGGSMPGGSLPGDAGADAGRSGAAVATVADGGSAAGPSTSLAGGPSAPDGATVRPVASGSSSGGLRPVLEGDPSMEDTSRGLAPVWVRLPAPREASTTTLAGYR